MSHTELETNPECCRLWPAHNRDKSQLTAKSCATLIASIRAQGNQIPVIVRRLHNDPVYAYEIICGARRHAAVSHLCAHGHPTKLRISIRDLTDREAFHLADLENRHRADLSAYETAADYAAALPTIFAGNQTRMAASLGIDRTSLNRHLALAALPPRILAAYANPNLIPLHHAQRLGPYLRSPVRLPQLLHRAGLEASLNAVRIKAGKRPTNAAIVLRRLMDLRPKPSTTRRITIRDPNTNVILATAVRHFGRPVAIVLKQPAAACMELRLSLIARILAAVAPAPLQERCTFSHPLESKEAVLF
jgi:ParB family chromosome partitioning protein